MYIHTISFFYQYNIYKKKTFISKRVIFLFLPNFRRLFENSSKVWKKPKYNSFRNKCPFFIYILIEEGKVKIYRYIYIEGNYKKLNGKFNNADKLNYALVISLLLSTLPALLNLHIVEFKQRKN